MSRHLENTDFLQVHNANPKNRRTTDCVIRAITTALMMNYSDVVMALAEWQIKTGYDPSSPEGYGRWLESIGWKKHKQPRKLDNKKYTGKEFCKIFNGTCIANIGGHHTVCVKDNLIWDWWDSSDGCIGNFWTPDDVDL